MAQSPSDFKHTDATRRRASVLESDLELRMQAVLDSISDGVIVADEQGRLQTFNKAAEKLIGKGPIPANAEDWPAAYGIYHLDGKTLVSFQELPLYRALGGETVRDVDFINKNSASPQAKLIRASGSPILDKHGLNRGALVFFHDITDEQQAREANQMLTRNLEQQVQQSLAELRETESQMRLLLDSTAEAIYGLDLDGKCTFYNPACIRMLGYDENVSLIGRNMHELIHHTRPDGTPYPSRECRIYQGFRQRSGTHVNDELLWRADGSSFPAEYWSYPVFRDGKLVGGVVTFLDISARRRSEQQLRQHQADMAHMVRVATMGEMATGLAHELNQPLYAIHNYARGLSRRIRSGNITDSELLQASDEIARESERAAEIIRSLRRYVGRAESKRVPVNINELVGAVTKVLLPDARQRQVDIVQDLATNLRNVVVDPIQIEQVLLNVIRNGVEAMSDCQSSNRQLSVTTSCPSSTSVRVTVRDCGDPISQEHFEQMFNAFFTSKQSGLGMGLPISRTIIDSHGGRIWARRTPVCGIVMNIELPVAGFDNSDGRDQ